MPCDTCQKYYTLDDVAKIYQVSKRTIQRIVGNPIYKIRVVMIGSRPRIPHDELTKFVKEFG